jgi:hypothetical protein
LHAKHPCQSPAVCREAERILAQLLQVPLKQSLGKSDEHRQHPGISLWRKYPDALHMALYDADALVAEGATPATDPVSWHYRQLRRKSPGFRPGDYLHSNHNRVPVPDITEPGSGPLTCAQCGDSFAAKRTDARYCSARCRKAASRAPGQAQTSVTTPRSAARGSARNGPPKVTGCKPQASQIICDTPGVPDAA